MSHALASGAVVESHAVVYRTPHAYCSHPSIALLAGGDWLVAFGESMQRRPFLHPPSDPRFLNHVTRSSDRGRTWTQPQVAPGYDWYGVETPGIAAISTGEVLLNQWRFHWYPRDLGRALWEAGEREIFVCGAVDDPSAHAWHPARSEEDWERHPFAWVRADGGAFVHISGDGGRTWTHTVEIDVSPYRGAFSPKGAVELSSGELLLALGSHDYDPAAASFVVRSSDRGRSWGSPVEVARMPGRVFSEPAAVVLGDGTVLVISREELTGHLHLSESADGGHSWSEPRPLRSWGYPAHTVAIADGRLLVVYGRRKPPYGIRAVISEDGGRSWSDEIVLRDDLPNDNLGYPAVIEYEPGMLFAVYYAERDDGITGIEATYFNV